MLTVVAGRRTRIIVFYTHPQKTTDATIDLMHGSVHLYISAIPTFADTDALATLHWLRVPERVQYKISVLTYKELHYSAPRYLVADLPCRRALRSASTSRLVAPPIKLSTVGSRAFPVAAAQVWNCLPEAVVSSSSLQTFRRQLKTRLFNFHTLT